MKSNTSLFIVFSLFLTGCFKTEPTYKGSIDTSLENENMLFNTKHIVKKGVLKKVKLENNIFIYKIVGDNVFQFTSIYELPFLDKLVKASFYNKKLQNIEPLENNIKKRKYLINTPLIEEIR